MILANSFLFSLTFSARIYTQLFDAEAERNKFIEKIFSNIENDIYNGVNVAQIFYKYII